MDTIELKKSLILRNQLLIEQQKLIDKWYKDLFDIIKKNISSLNLNNNAYRNKVAFNVVKKSLDKVCYNITKNLRSMIVECMQDLCNQVIDEIQDQAGVEVDKDNLVEDILSAVVTGSIYNTNWKLSNAIEKIIDSNEDLIYDIIEEGMAEGKSAEEIAKEILNVLNPNSNQQQRSYTKDHKTLYVGKPSYQAHRLSRTTLQHTYQTAIVATAKRISEITSRKVMIQWISVLAPNTCQVCVDRHLHLYAPDDLPLDHPNGQCTFEVRII